MHRTEALAALSALANDTRLALMKRLIAAGDDGLSAGDIARALEMSASRLSFHIADLERAGLVTVRRMSRQMIYKADHVGLGRVIGYLMNDCCAGHPKVMACCGPIHPAPEDNAASH